MKLAHEVLGIGPSATEAEVRAAFRRYAARYHPDHGGDPAAFLRGQEAYQQLVRGASDQSTESADAVTFHRQRNLLRTFRRALTITTHRLARRPVPPPRVQ